MSWQRNTSGHMILWTFIIWIIWDVYAFFAAPDATLSVVITDLATQSVAFPVVIGGLVGHWFIPRIFKKNLQKQGIVVLGVIFAILVYEVFRFNAGDGFIFGGQPSPYLKSVLLFVGIILGNLFFPATGSDRDGL